MHSGGGFVKVRRQLGRLEPMILDPLRSVNDNEWHRAPDGKWTIAQILSHLAVGVDLVGVTFEARAGKENMERRATPKQSLLRHLLLGVGRIPLGLKSPKVVTPGERPEPEEIQAQFRMGVERIERILDEWPEEKQVAVFVAHPIMGDLNLPEWIRFHFVHCRHHSIQIRERLRWLRTREAAVD